MGSDLRAASNGQVLAVDLRPGEYRELDFDQQGADLEIDVFAPSGELLFTVDGPRGAWGVERVPLVGNPAGRYRLLIKKNNGHGTYRISAVPSRRAERSERGCFQAAAAYFRGQRLASSNELAEAEEELRNARRQWRTCGSASGEADALFKLASLQVQGHEVERALTALSGALSLYRRLKIRRMQAVALVMQGAIYETDLGRTVEAVRLYDEALRFPREREILDVLASTFNNRSKLRVRLGDFSGALQDAESALTLARSTREVNEQIRAEDLLGQVYRRLGEVEEALRRHQRVGKLLRSEPTLATELAATQIHLGDDYRALEQWDLAISNYLSGIRTWRRLGKQREEATALNNLSIAYSQTYRWGEARDALRRVHEIDTTLGDRLGAAVASVNLGWALASLGHYDEAGKLYRKALRLFRRQRLLPDQAVAYFGLAWIESRRGNLNEARRLLGKSLEIVEEIHGRAESRTLWTRFLAGWQPFYSLLVEVLMEQHDREPAKGFDIRAFLVSEKARCRTLLESVEGGIVLPPVSWKEIRGILGEDTVLLEYFLGRKRSFLWAVTSHGLSSYVLPGQDKIAALAREVHDLLAESYDSRIWPRLIRQSADLSQILLGPVAERLNGARILVVAPPELQGIPFGFLPQLPLTFSPANRWPLTCLDRFEILSEPSATFIATLRRLRAGRRVAPSLLAVIGDPAPFPSPGSRSRRRATFPSLRYSRREALAIARASEGRATCFLGRKANRALLLDGGLKLFRMLHFSVHGLPSSADPQESALVLSGVDEHGQKIESRLRAHEIARLELHADLVMLGACGTGLGAAIQGEGLVGLTQAFFAAGASSVGASLWNVSDLETSELMARFYRDVLRSGLSPSAALRDAQLGLRQRRSSPYFWSGFILQGEWR